MCGEKNNLHIKNEEVGMRRYEYVPRKFRSNSFQPEDTSRDFGYRRKKESMR